MLLHEAKLFRVATKMVKDQSESHNRFKNIKQDKLNEVSDFNYEELSKCQWCNRDCSEAMKKANAHESCMASDCSQFGCNTDRTSTLSCEHSHGSVNATIGVINDTDNALAVDNTESLCLKHDAHEHGRHSSAWHKSYVSSWLTWLDEPELMIQEGSTIHSTSGDGILAEINASIVYVQSFDFFSNLFYCRCFLAASVLVNAILL